MAIPPTQKQAVLYNARDRRKSLMDPAFGLFRTHTLNAADNPIPSASLSSFQRSQDVAFKVQVQRDGATLPNGLLFEIGDSTLGGVAAYLDGADVTFVAGNAQAATAGFYASLDHGPGDLIHGVNGTLRANTSVPVVGNIGNAGLFEPTASSPSDSAIIFADHDDYDLGAAFTVGAWIKVDAVSGTQQVISKYRISGNQRSWELYITTTTVVFVFTTDGAFGTAVTTFGSPTITTGWHHVAVSRTAGGTIQMFFDGVAVGSPVVNTGTVFPGTAELWLGAFDNPADEQPLAGLIDDAFVINDTAIFTSTFTPPTGPMAVNGLSVTAADVMNYSAGVGGRKVDLVFGLKPATGTATIWANGEEVARTTTPVGYMGSWLPLGDGAVGDANGTVTARVPGPQAVTLANASITSPLSIYTKQRPRHQGG